MPESTVGPTTPVELVEQVYDRYPVRLETARARLGRPLTFAEKVLFAHADDVDTIGLERGVDYADYRPDRVAMQDATAQMALLQFMTAGLPTVAVPSTVHCDHLIQAHVGADTDLASALDVNSEVYEFLRTVSAKYGIGFWKPGSGIIHQVVLEQYAFPGGMMIGTDSHTPNAGGLGMVAIGVGGADAVDVMAGWPFNTRIPQVIGVQAHRPSLRVGRGEGRHPQGRRHPHRQGRHRRDRRVLRPGRRVDLGHRQGDDLQHGRRDRRDLLAVPLRRPGGRSTSRRPHREAPGRPRRPLRRAPPRRPRGRGRAPSASTTASSRSTSTSSSRTSSGRTRPTSTARSPRSRPRRSRRATRSTSAYALVGSCTNSSYEDIGRAAHVARQAKAAGLQVRTPLLITPGSEQVRATIERDGYLADLEAIGATVLANACGPCIGQWQRDDIQKGERNTIVTSFNRNFPARNDGNADTLCVHRLTRDRHRDGADRAASTSTSCTTPSPGPTARAVQLAAPTADELPDAGFDPGESGFVAPAADGVVRRGRGGAGSRAPRAARAVPGVGRPATTRACRVLDEGRGEVHHRPHLSRRAVAAVPRPPRRTSPATCSSARTTRSLSTSRAPASTSATDRCAPLPELAKAYKDAGISLGRGRRRELRRGLVARARGDGAALHGRRGGDRALVRPHPRGEPEEAGRAGADVREIPTTTSRSGSTTPST